MFFGVDIMLKAKFPKKGIIRLLSLALALICLLTASYSEFFGVLAEADSQSRKALSAGQQNIVKRAYQMTDIKWTPQKNVYGWNEGITYYAGKTYTGLPYGQPVYASYVPWSTSLEGFISAVNNKNSRMYTDYSSYYRKAPYYSTDCSAFVSWAWNLGSRQTTGTIKNYAVEISRTSFDSAEVGDSLCLAGSHAVLITDITYDSRNRISSIEISEATTDKRTFYCCQRIIYGEGGQYSLEYLWNKYFGEGYILYRSKNRDSVTYTHSCAVPLKGDSCEKCGYGYEPKPCTHSFSGVITKNPTCTDSGVKTYTCSKCSSSYTEKIQSHGHSFSSSVTKNPTCTADGIRAYTCSKCDSSYTEKISPTGHSYSYTVTKNPTCTEIGIKKYTCSGCKNYYTDNIPSSGHSFVNGKCADCALPDPDAQKAGDVDNDGEVTASDARLILRASVGLEFLSDESKKLADINLDGIINSTDARRILRVAVGLESLNATKN